MSITLAKPLPKGAEFLLPHVEAAGAKHGISPFALLGVCYAESNYGAALKPPGPTGSGDFIARPSTPDRDAKMAKQPLPGVVKKQVDGIKARKIEGPVMAWVPTHTGWGCGLMQFDYEAHFDFCASGAWKDPAAIIDRAAKLLADNRRALKKALPSLTGEALESAMFAAYNAGVGRVTKTIQAGKALDTCTFHPGYHTKIMRKAEELAGRAGAYASDEARFA